MMNEVKSILVVDCGIATTTAILIEEANGVYALTARAEAPTTLGEPDKDVTAGVSAAIASIERQVDRRLQHEGGRGVITPCSGEKGVDMFLCTSSTGGGLQMAVAGLVRIMTADSAERAALGAGAMVMDVMAIDDGRLPPERIQRLRDLRPDMVLLSGGVDGGNMDEVVALAEQVAQAKLRPDLPVIYAGNIAARDRIELVLGGKARLFFVSNVRPVLEEEVLEPAADEIHRRYLDHVVQNAPGFRSLSEWATSPIIPTTAALGYMVEASASHLRHDTLAVNIGEATTDVFSVVRERFTRTVSGNLGMGSSIGNVMREARVENITRWLPFGVSEDYVRNTLRNKALGISIASTTENLMLEHAVAREVMRLSLAQHRSSVVGLRGVQRQRDVSSTFHQTFSGDSLLDLMSIGTIIGAGSVFSQVSRPVQAMLILLDGLQPEGLTDLYVDRYYTSAHLGVLSTELPRVAYEVFYRDSLFFLGTVIGPVGMLKPGEPAVTISVESPEGRLHSEIVEFGTIKAIPLGPEPHFVVVKPAPSLDVGRGRGKPLRVKARGGACGLIIDARGRQLMLSDNNERVLQIGTWFKELEAYPLEGGVDRD